MSQREQDLRDAVRKRYAAIATTSENYCGPACCDSSQVVGGDFNMIGDAYKDVEGYVAEADLKLGCGVPVDHAGMKPGDVVLDLGSGAGIDAFVARREVGAEGQVIGVDMTPEMIAKARENTDKLGYDNVEFRLGEIENLPVDPNSIGVVISNCVLNLVPDKSRAFAEIYRVLKPGGHFCISDIVISQPLPDWAVKAAELYAGCVAGALLKAEYLDLISRAGFGGIVIKSERRIDIPRDIIDENTDTSDIEPSEIDNLHVLSITVTASKPH